MPKLKSNLSWGSMVPEAKKLLSNGTVREFLSEMTGTFILLIFGLGSHVVYKAKFDAPDLFASAFSFGVGALISISATLDVSGAHLNPAVSVAMASIGRLPWKKVPHYLAGQYLGAFFSGLVTYLIYGDVIKSFDPHFTETGSSVYTTFPGKNVTLTAAFADQVLSTGILSFSILAADGPKLDRSIHPLFFSLVITGLVIAFNYNAGAALNPARDLGPRLLTLLVGYNKEVFNPLSYNYWWLVTIIGPHLGALIGVWYYILFIDPDTVRVPVSRPATSTFPTNNQPLNTAKLRSKSSSRVARPVQIES